MALLARRWHVVGTVGTSLAPLASRWHVFFFPDVLFLVIIIIIQRNLLLIKQINYFINLLIREKGIKKHFTSSIIIAIIIKLFIAKLFNKTYNFISLSRVIKLSNYKHLIPHL
jgi:hypothetical protein